MAKQNINVGAAPNDKTGDQLRVAFTKINDNFTELYTNGIGGNGATGPQGAAGATGSQGVNGATGPIFTYGSASSSLSSGVLTVNLSKAVVKVTLNQNVTSITFTNAPVSGQSSSTIVVFTQDGTGGRTVSGTGFLTQAGLGLSVSSSANSVSLISFIAYDASNIIALNIGENYA